MWRRAGGVVAAGAVAIRLVEAHGRLDRVALAGGSSPLAEVNRWLPWQLWDNLAHGRSPLDATVFLDAPSSLLAVGGNPGIAWFTWVFHAFGSATVGAGLGALVVLVLDILGAAAFGGAFGVPWLGALAGASCFWATGAASGQAALVCFGPAAFAAAAALASRRRLAVALAVGAALVAPVPSVAFFLGAGALPLAALAALGLLAAPLGTFGAPGVAPADLLWPAGRAARALPLALPLAGVATWNARGMPRLAALGIAAGVLLGITPGVVSGFRISAAWAPGSGAALAAAAALALAAGLPLAARLVNHRRLGLGALLLLEATLPIVWGGGAMWAPKPAVSEAFRSMAATPRRAVVYVLPEERSPAAGVGEVLVHRQRVARLPSVESASEGGFLPGAHVASTSADTLARLVRESSVPLVFVLTGGDAAEASEYASALGPPHEVTAGASVWSWP